MKMHGMLRFRPKLLGGSEQCYLSTADGRFVFHVTEG